MPLYNHLDEQCLCILIANHTTYNPFQNPKGNNIVALVSEKNVFISLFSKQDEVCHSNSIVSYCLKTRDEVCRLNAVASYSFVTNRFDFMPFLTNLHNALQGKRRGRFVLTMLMT